MQERNGRSCGKVRVRLIKWSVCHYGPEPSTASGSPAAGRVRHRAVCVSLLPVRSADEHRRFQYIYVYIMKYSVYDIPRRFCCTFNDCCVCPECCRTFYLWKEYALFGWVSLAPRVPGVAALTAGLGRE